MTAQMGEKKWFDRTTQIVCKIPGCVSRDCVFAIPATIAWETIDTQTGYTITFQECGEDCTHPDYPSIRHKYLEQLNKQYDEKCASAPYSRRSRSKFHKEWMDAADSWQCPLYQI